MSGSFESDSDSVSELRAKPRRFSLFSKLYKDTDDAPLPVYWPRDLLPSDIPNARILTFGYDTHIKHWAGEQRSLNTVRDFAWDFLMALESGRRNEPARPLVFVVHSLGGIIVKEMLRRSCGCREGQNHLRDIFSSTIGMIFFGTPHGGTDSRGALRRTAESLVRAVGFKANEQILNSLLPSSERLRELRDEFSPLAHEKIHSFQEELGMKALGGGKVCQPLHLELCLAQMLNSARSWTTFVLSQLPFYRNDRAHPAEPQGHVPFLRPRRPGI